MSDPVLVAIAAAAGAVIASLINAVANRARVNAEVDKLEVDAVAILTQTSADLLEQVKAESQAREGRLLSRISELEVQLDHLSTMVSALSQQLTAHGVTPNPRWELP
jgi:tRNA U55 pseudouridine synthase TruB